MTREEIRQLIWDGTDTPDFEAGIDGLTKLFGDMLDAKDRDIDRLTAQLAELEAECFKLAAGVCEYRSGDDHGNPLCLMVRKPIPPNMYPVTALKEPKNG